MHFKPRASPQAELRPGRLPTSRITTRGSALAKVTGAQFILHGTCEDLPSIGEFVAKTIYSFFECYGVAPKEDSGEVIHKDGSIVMWHPIGSAPVEIVSLVCAFKRGLGTGFRMEHLARFSPSTSPSSTVRTMCERIVARTREPPQVELRLGKLPTTRITTREPTHKQNYDQGTGRLAGWLAVGITTREPVMRLYG